MTKEIYADGCQIYITPFTCHLQFGLIVPQDMQQSQDPGRSSIATMVRRTEVTVLVTPALAKIIAIQLTKSLKANEDRQGVKIMIPPSVGQELGISGEDWT